APTARRQSVLLNVVAVSLDEQCTALMAPRVLEIADLTRQVSRVDVSQAITPADFGRAHQHFRSGVLRIVHSVVLVERGHVPWNERRDASQECGEPFELVVRVVEARDEERDDLEPDPHLMERADRVQDRLDAAAELSVMSIVEALEIDLVEIDPRA